MAPFFAFRPPGFSLSRSALGGAAAIREAPARASGVNVSASAEAPDGRGYYPQLGALSHPFFRWEGSFGFPY